MESRAGAVLWLLPFKDPKLSHEIDLGSECLWATSNSQVWFAHLSVSRYALYSYTHSRFVISLSLFSTHTFQYVWRHACLSHLRSLLPVAYLVSPACEVTRDDTVTCSSWGFRSALDSEAGYFLNSPNSSVSFPKTVSWLLINSFSAFLV